MVTKARMIIYLSAVYWAFIATSIAQPNILSCRNSHLDQDKPIVFLTYIKKEIIVNSDKKKEKKLLIKLTNNSSCNIQLTTPDNVSVLSRYEILRDDKGKPIRLKRRETELFQPSFMLNEVKYSVICYYEDKAGNGFQVNNLNGCLVYTSLLKSGESVLLNVSTSVLQKRPNLSVPYSYEGDSSPFSKASEHAILDLKGIKLELIKLKKQTSK